MPTRGESVKAGGRHNESYARQARGSRQSPVSSAVASHGLFIVFNLSEANQENIRRLYFHMKWTWHFPASPNAPIARGTGTQDRLASQQVQ